MFFAYSFDGCVFRGTFKSIDKVFNILNKMKKRANLPVYIAVLDPSTMRLVEPMNNNTILDALSKCRLISTNLLYNKGYNNDEFIVEEIANDITSAFYKWFHKYGVTGYASDKTKIILYKYNKLTDMWEV